MTYLKNFIRDEEGQDMVEYALLLGAIALLALVGAGALGGAINTKYGDLSTKIGAAS